MRMWSDQSRQHDRDRRAKETAQRIKARRRRADNRRHALEHPVSHLFGKLFGR